MRGERDSFLLRPLRDGVGSPAAAAVVETIRLRLLNRILLFLLLNLFLGRVQDDRDPLPVSDHRLYKSIRGTSQTAHIITSWLSASPAVTLAALVRLRRGYDHSEKWRETRPRL